MATLDYTGSAAAGAFVPEQFAAMAYDACLYRRLTIADIIAADTTMTTNGYITADDIIQCLHVTDGFFFLKAAMRILTSCTATVNADTGLAGGVEAIASFDVDGAAGTMLGTVETDAWAGGKIFAANDTIDVQFITANCAVGDLALWVWGHQMVIPS